MSKKPLEVVVVDDEEQITELLKTFIHFSAKDAHVHTFNDSALARDFLMKNPADVVITDYKMPRYNGLEVLEAAPTKARKILISGYVSEIAEEKLNSINATFFEKPVPMKKIGKIITDEETAMAS
jgi:two-component system, response regulator YesN